MPASQSSSELLSLLVERIRRQGPITFAEFMQACLYHPAWGYYTRRVPEGADDYYTSPEVHPIFGRLLARQFAEMWEVLGKPEPFHLVEFGAGDGRLAAQVMRWVEESRPELAKCVRFLLIESSAARRERGARWLRQSTSVEWKAEVDADALVGCVYSNEFVDALPVHRVVARDTGLRELFVAVRKSALVMEEGEPSTSALADYLGRYGVPLRKGQQAEINLAALGWIEQVAAKLERGFLLTVDYGYLAPELYSPARLGGTLLAYRAHRASEDVLACPGAQDLTAHVNFSALIEHGRDVGLLPLGFTSQAKFLLALGKGNEFADLYAPHASDLERYQARLRLKQLIYPEGMGEIFRILVQGKRVGPVRLTGLGET